MVEPKTGGRRVPASAPVLGGFSGSLGHEWVTGAAKIASQMEAHLASLIYTGLVLPAAPAAPGWGLVAAPGGSVLPVCGPRLAVGAGGRVELMGAPGEDLEATRHRTR